jgi:hypothetical protein
MAVVENGFTVLFPADYDSQSEFETPLRGYLSEVEVELEGMRYRLFFIDPVRLGQELKSNIDSGRPYFAEPNLIILPEVTTDAIKKAVEGLARNGFFQHLKNSACGTTRPRDMLTDAG